jgi:hypothetical protein
MGKNISKGEITTKKMWKMEKNMTGEFSLKFCILGYSPIIFPHHGSGKLNLKLLRSGKVRGNRAKISNFWLCTKILTHNFKRK